jgi:hypothetical protein
MRYECGRPCKGSSVAASGVSGKIIITFSALRRTLNLYCSSRLHPYLSAICPRSVMSTIITHPKIFSIKNAGRPLSREIERGRRARAFRTTGIKRKIASFDAWHAEIHGAQSQSE